MRTFLSKTFAFKVNIKKKKLSSVLFSLKMYILSKKLSTKERNAILNSVA